MFYQFALKVISILSVLTITGCASSPAKLPKDWLYKKNDAAVVTGLVGVSTNGEFRHSWPYNDLILKSEHSETSMTLAARYAFGTDVTVSDYGTSNRKYGVFKFTVKPGKYEIVNTKFWYADAYGYRSVSAKEDFSIPFIFEPGSTYYIGSFLAHGIRGKNIFGLATPTSGFWVLDSSPEIAMEQIKLKYPDLDVSEIQAVEVLKDAPPYILLKSSFEELKSSTKQAAVQKTTLD